MLSEIQSSLRQGVSRDAHRVGPFLIHFDEHSDHPFRNYAIPEDDARPSSAEVSDLVAAFVARDRRPRLEYVGPVPAVDEALATAGFVVDTRLPLMTTTHGELRVLDAPRGVEVAVAVAEDELRAVAWVQNIAYTGEAAVTEADIDRLRTTHVEGGVVVLARAGGEPAGAGLYTPPCGGLAEIGAVAVLPEYRRRGVASVVSADLSRRVFAAGVVPYLQTETHNENRLYGRLGYSTVGELTAVSLPPQNLR